MPTWRPRLAPGLLPPPASVGPRGSGYTASSAQASLQVPSLTLVTLGLSVPMANVAQNSLHSESPGVGDRLQM